MEVEDKEISRKEAAKTGEFYFKPFDS